MSAALRFAGMIAALAATPALAVGLSPLRKEGPTAGPAKAFYLTVINPYPDPRAFRAYVDGPAAEAGTGSEGASGNVVILPPNVVIKGKGQRRITVIVRDLKPGETRETRICAQLAKQEGMINARVCSTLVARRLAARG